MAIVLDKLLGSNSTYPGTVSSYTFTTTQAVASGGFITVGWGMWPSPAVNASSVSGGGLTWTIDKAGTGETGSFLGGGVAVGIASAQAPSGLASSTVITLNLSGSADTTIVFGGASWTGVATSSPVDGTPPLINGVSPAGATWATGSQSITAGSLMVGMGFTNDSGTRTSSPTSPGLEVYDVNDGSFCGGVMEYRIESSAGSYNLGGTWSANSQSLSCAVAYLAAAASPPTPAPSLRVTQSTQRW